MGEPTDFADIEIKIGRAEEHLAELNRRVADWIAEHVIGVVHEHDPETGWHQIRGKHVPDAPREWGAILGDFGYNLRAALEYMVELLLIANGSTPETTNQFPIISEAKDAHIIKVHLKGVHRDAIDIIEKVQPYARRIGTQRDALEVIADLANIDKHHRLHGSLVATDRPRATWFKITVLGSGTADIKLIADVGQPISDANLIAIRFDPPHIKIKVEMNDADPPRLDILFRNGAPFLLGVTPQLVVETRSILKALRPFMTAT